MRLHGDAFLLLVLDTPRLHSGVFRAGMRLCPTISCLMLLTFSFSHFSSLPVLISAPLGDISQGAEERPPPLLGPLRQLLSHPPPRALQDAHLEPDVWTGLLQM